MLRLNGSPIITEWFPNNETKVKDVEKKIRYGGHNFIEFQYTADEELITLMFVKKRLDEANVTCSLAVWHMPYNYRAKKFKGDLLAHPYTRDFVNWLNFANVEVMENNHTVNHEMEGNAGYIASGYANLKLNGKWLDQADDFAEDYTVEGENVLEFKYVTDDDLVALMFAKKRLDEAKVSCCLSLESIPYSSMDTITEGLNTCRYICDFIRWLNFEKVFFKQPNNT